MIAQPVPLESGQVHLWQVDLDRSSGEVPDRWARLSDDERERAIRFHRDIDRNRYIAAHAALRTLLARYHRMPEYRVPFDAGPDGKPSLGTGAEVHFNLSHSGGLGLVVLAAGTSVGVDLEAVDFTLATDALAERFFSPHERGALRRLDPARSREAFFHVWSQKQAYLKGRGKGIAHGMNYFDVVANPLDGAGLLVDRRDPEAVLRWRLFALEPAPGFAGSLAVEGAASAVLRYEWTEESWLAPTSVVV